MVWIGANSPDKTGLVGTESALTRALAVVPGAAKIRQILPLTDMVAPRKKNNSMK